MLIINKPQIYFVSPLTFQLNKANTVSTRRMSDASISAQLKAELEFKYNTSKLESPLLENLCAELNYKINDGCQMQEKILYKF